MVKVAVLGAGGGVGQALSLQLRLSRFVDELALYDRTKAAGVAVDLSHIPVKQTVRGYKAADDGLQKTLTGADIVIISVGRPLSPKDDIINRNDYLQSGTSIVGPLIECCSKTCPKALIMMVSNPVNALVPFAAEILRKNNTFDAKRLFGVTTVDVLRARVFLTEMEEIAFKHEKDVQVDVIGGHSAETTVPLFSRVDLARELSSEQLDMLVYRVQHAGFQVYNAKDRKSGATLSTAYATMRMVERIFRALKGEQGMRECSYVYLPGIEGGNEIVKAIGVDYFAAPVEFGKDGAARVLYPLKGLSKKESEMIEKGVKSMTDDIKLGKELGERFGR